MGFALMGLGFILGLVAFACCIMVIIKMFQNQQTGLGIGSIIGLFVCGLGYLLTLIFGWQNKQKWGLQKVMPIYTGALVFGLIFYGVGLAIQLPQMIEQQQNEMRNQMQQFQQEMPSGMGGNGFNFDN